jgi:hypothetical protein
MKRECVYLASAVYFIRDHFIGFPCLLIFVLSSFRTPRPTDNSAPVSTYPHPNLSLPHPSLSLDFRMSVALNPKISVGPTPFGHRNWISFVGGTWSGSWGTGIVLVVPNSCFVFLDSNKYLARRSRQSIDYT